MESGDEGRREGGAGNFSFSGKEGGREGGKEGGRGGFFASRPLRFEIQKEALVRGYGNENMKPSRHARTLRLHVLKENMWTAEALEREARTLTIEEMEQFVPLLLSEIQVDGLYQVEKEGGMDGWEREKDGNV